MTSINSKTNLVKALAFLALPAAAKGQDTLSAQPSMDSNTPNTEQTIQSTAVDAIEQSDTISLEEAMRIGSDTLADHETAYPIYTPPSRWYPWNGNLSLTGGMKNDNSMTAGIDFLYRADNYSDVINISSDIAFREASVILDHIHLMYADDPGMYSNIRSVVAVDYADGIGAVALGIGFDDYNGGIHTAYLGPIMSIADAAKFDNVLGERQGYAGFSIGYDYNNLFMDDALLVQARALTGYLGYQTHDEAQNTLDSGHGAIIRAAASIDYRITPDILVGIQAKLGHIFGHDHQVAQEVGIRIGITLR